jgi:hypothetical protein
MAFPRARVGLEIIFLAKQGQDSGNAVVNDLSDALPVGRFSTGTCSRARARKASLFGKLLPKWLIIFGLALSVVGELSALSLVLPQLIFLIPLTRFPSFIWLIVAGFKMPSGAPEDLS